MKKQFSLLLAILLIIVLTGCAKESAATINLEELLTHSEEALESYLVGTSRDTILEAWGQPDDTLSGLMGDVYRIPDSDRQLILYYGEDGAITDLKIIEQVANK